jgi:hypothetical protein
LPRLVEELAEEFVKGIIEPALDHLFRADINHRRKNPLHSENHRIVRGIGGRFIGSYRNESQDHRCCQPGRAGESTAENSPSHFHYTAVYSSIVPRGKRWH